MDHSAIYVLYSSWHERKYDIPFFSHIRVVVWILVNKTWQCVHTQRWKHNKYVCTLYSIDIVVVAVVVSRPRVPALRFQTWGSDPRFPDSIVPGSNLEAVVPGSNLEQAVRGSNLETVVQGSNLEASVTGSNLELAVLGSNLEAAVLGSNL